MTIVEFIERVLDTKLADYEKDVVIDMYKAVRNNKLITGARPARMGRKYYERLAYLTHTYIMCIRGYINPKNLKAALNGIEAKKYVRDLLRDPDVVIIKTDENNYIWKGTEIQDIPDKFKNLPVIDYDYKWPCVNDQNILCTTIYCDVSECEEE